MDICLYGLPAFAQQVAESDESARPDGGAIPVVGVVEAAELDGYYPVGHWFLGLIYQQTGELPRAIAEFNKAAGLSDAPIYRALLGRGYGLTGDRVKVLCALDDLRALSRQK